MASEQTPSAEYDEDHRSSNDAILHFWQSFRLSDKRNEWDLVNNEMREYKTASINGRKKLNEMTKTFRAKPREEQLLTISELLKAYQEEIDQLSKRSRFTETSFGNIYKALYEAPDPAPCIESLFNTINSGTMHSLEIERLKTEIRQYDEEFQRLKNQDITIRRLEDQLQEYKDNLEEKIAEEAERRVRIVREQCDQQLLESREAQRSMERRMQQAMDTSKAAQQSLDRIQSQQFEETQRAENRISAMIMERNTLMDQNQRLSLRIAELENDKTNWVAMASGSGDASSGSVLGPNSSSSQQWQVQREAFEQLIQSQQDQLRAVEDQSRQERAKLDSTIRDLQQAVGKEKANVQGLKQELSKAVTRVQYENLRREVKTLRRIAFHTDEEDDDDVDGAGDVGTEASHAHDGDTLNDSRDDDIDRPTTVDDMLTPEKTPMKKQLSFQTPSKTGKSTAIVPSSLQKKPKTETSVEDLLTRRLRIVENELALSRSELAEAKMQAALAREATEKFRTSADALQLQLQRAEQELEQRSVALEQLLANQQVDANGERGSTDDNLAQLLLGEDSSPSTTALPGGRTRTSTRNAGNSSRQALDARDSSGGSIESLQQLVKALQTQRDRNKERLASHESRLLTMQQQLDHEIALKQQLEQDNLSLYRKLKFLQSYHGGSSGGNLRSEGRYIDDPYRVTDRSDRDGGGDVESRYSAMYEARMSPFAEFSTSERQRKWRELSTADRIVLNTAMAVVTNATGRTFLLIYFGAMHLLVFGTMYYLAHSVPHTNTVQCITDPHQAQLH